MGIPVLQDGVFDNFLIVDYLYVVGRIVGWAGCGGGGRMNSFRALPRGRHDNIYIYVEPYIYRALYIGPYI